MYEYCKHGPTASRIVWPVSCRKNVCKIANNVKIERDWIIITQDILHFSINWRRVLQIKDQPYLNSRAERVNAQVTSLTSQLARRITTRMTEIRRHVCGWNKQPPQTEITHWAFAIEEQTSILTLWHFQDAIRPCLHLKTTPMFTINLNRNFYLKICSI